VDTPTRIFFSMFLSRANTCSDRHILPTEIPECLQYPWINLSNIMYHGLHKLLTSLLSKLFEASNLETMEVDAVGFKEASKLIHMIVSLLYVTAPRLRKIVVTFSLHDSNTNNLGPQPNCFVICISAADIQLC
jgi:hypothetical protein